MTTKRYRELMGQCDALISICKSISATAKEPALACRRDEYTDAALAVPADEIPDTIEWTERYLETLKVRTLVGCRGASESQREAAGTADEKPDGQAEND